MAFILITELAGALSFADKLMFSSNSITFFVLRFIVLARVEFQGKMSHTKQHLPVIVIESEVYNLDFSIIANCSCTLLCITHANGTIFYTTNNISFNRYIFSYDDIVASPIFKL